MIPLFISQLFGKQQIWIFHVMPISCRFEGKSSKTMFLPLSDAFQCRILLCLWHVRRGWLKGLLKHCHNFDVQREMFKHLGRILYCTRNASSTADAVEEFLQIYIDQSEFVEYFRNKWFPKIGTVLHGYFVFFLWGGASILLLLFG